MNVKYFMFALLALILTMACSGNKKSDANGAGGDSLATAKDSVQLYVEEEDKTDYSKFVEKPVRVDTTVGDWEIHARQFYNGRKFTEGNDIYADYAVKFNIFKARKPVFKNYKVDSKALAGSGYMDGFSLSLAEYFEITPTTVYVGFGYCEPETDNCAEYILALGGDGSVRKYEASLCSADGDMDGYVDDVYWFFSLYVNELSQASPNADAIKQVLNRYCTKAFAKQLQSQKLKNNLLLASPQFDYRWLRSLAVYSMDMQTQTCVVSYTKTDGTEVYRRLKMQLKPGHEYQYYIAGVMDADKSDVVGDEDEEETVEGFCSH